MPKDTGKSHLRVWYFVLSLPMLLVLFSAARAQDGTGQPAAVPPAAQNLAGDQLISELNLTPDQLERIRQAREENKEARRVATVRLREAQRALDEAIYSGGATSALIEERAREVSAAQSEVVRMRALNEFNIIRVLTPDQLVKLRELRAEVQRQRQQQLREQRQRNAALAPGAGGRKPAQQPLAKPPRTGNGRAGAAPASGRGGRQP